jgi:putative peptidoglycan lipid II flippase
VQRKEYLDMSNSGKKYKELNLKQKTVKLSMITGINTFAGFAFHILLGRKFGVSWQLDCFFVVLVLFSCLGLFNSFFTSLFIPVFNEVKKGGFEKSLVFVDVVIKWSVLVSFLIIAFTLLFNNSIIKLLAPGFNERNITLSVEINRIMIFGLVFFSISSIVVYTLNALYYYFIPALADLLRPTLNICAIFILIPLFGIRGIAISYLVSNFLVSTILLLYLFFKTGWHPTLCFYHRKLPNLINKSSKMALSTFIWGLRDIIIRNVASRLGEGAVTLFSYAEKIITTVVRLAVTPIARVFYSRVSEWASLSKWANIRSLFMRTVRINVSLSLFISSGLIAFLPSFLNLFFLGSKFTVKDIHILSMLLNIMIIYFVIGSFEIYLSRIIFATKRAGVVIINATVGVTILFMCSLFLTKKYGIYGLAIAITFSQSIVCSLYYLFAKKTLKVNFFSIVSKFLGGFIIAVVFGFLGIMATQIITNNLVIVAIVFPIWLILYLLFAKLFMKEEVKIILAK